MRALLLIVAVGSGCWGCADATSEADAGAGHVELELELEFAARAGDEPFKCGRELSGLGSTEVSAEPLDLRLYVHDVELLRDDAAPVAFELVADDTWQSERVALLDFEDASGRCRGGTEETHTALRGRAPPGAYVGVSFRVGVPHALNHLDLSTAESPLDVPGMYWSWQGGYKYLRADVATAEHPDGYVFHLGAAGCAGSPANGYDCADYNVARITLEGDISEAIVLDVKRLFADVDLASVPDQVSDLVPGCMSSATDPECARLLAALGLPEGEQRVFELP
jgi:uncharacterized repeat protein (TIGR04052 family)